MADPSKPTIEVKIAGNPYTGLSVAYEEGFEAGRGSVLMPAKNYRLDTRAELVVERALQVALSHGSNYIAPIHLIIAALQADPDLVDDLGVTPDAARQAARRTVNHTRLP